MNRTLQTFGRNRLMGVFLLGMFAWCGCDASKTSGSSETPEVAAAGEEQAGATLKIELEGVEGGFFDDESLLEGAIDIAAEEAEVVCVGQGGREVRGMVLAPHARLARRWQFPDWLVGRAEASPLEGELPVGGVAVRLYRVDGRGGQVGDAFARTQTSSSGRYCLRLPDDVEPGPTVMVEASATSEGREYRLRRMLLNAEDGDLHLASESFVQVLLENSVDLERAPLVSLMNLEVFAQTAVDLLNPVALSDEGGVEAGVALVKATLLEDARFSTGLSRLQGKK